jgi:hypothetical protein
MLQLNFTIVSQLFPIPEKLYEIEHPRYAKQFDDISLVTEDELGYWISKRWCRGPFTFSTVFILLITLAILSKIGDC